jgi:hypothetical protein
MSGPDHEHSNRQDVSTIRDATKEFVCDQVARLFE